MQKYRYKALAPNGAVSTDIIDAAGRDEVVSLLRAKNYLPVSVEPFEGEDSDPTQEQRNGADPLPVTRSNKSQRPRLHRKDFVLFTAEFESLLSSGLTAERALDVLTRTSSSRSIVNLAEDLRSKIRAGRSLSESLADFPETFDGFYVAMVMSGEASGQLEKTLQRLNAYLGQIDQLVSSIRSELTYPAILAAATLISLGLLFGFVIPQFELLFQGSDEKLPAVLVTIFAVSSLFDKYGWQIAGAASILGVAIYLIVIRPGDGKKFAYRAVRRIPIVGPIFFLHSLEKFCRSLATLLDSGLQLSPSLSLAANVCANPAITTAVAAADKAVKEGKLLSSAFDAGDVFPPLIVELVRVAEESGQLSATMTQLADIYRGQVQQALKRVTTMVGPALVTLIGLFIAVIAATLYSTILDLNLLAR